MTIARHYFMIAKAGSEATLETELRRLGDTVRPIAGCEGVEIMQDVGNAARFVFIEKWDSVESHKEGGKTIPREAFAGLVGALAEPLDGAYFDYLVTE